MATLERDIAHLIADKDEARRIVNEQYALMGIASGPALTAAEVRAMMIAEGINPNDNLFSRGIIEAREEKVRGNMGSTGE